MTEEEMTEEEMTEEEQNIATAKAVGYTLECYNKGNDETKNYFLFRKKDQGSYIRSSYAENEECAWRDLIWQGLNFLVGSSPYFLHQQIIETLQECGNPKIVYDYFYNIDKAIYDAETDTMGMVLKSYGVDPAIRTKAFLKAMGLWTKGTS